MLSTTEMSGRGNPMYWLAKFEEDTKKYFRQKAELDRQNKERWRLEEIERQLRLDCGLAEWVKRLRHSGDLEA
jgi:hypothetical protein